LEGEVSKSSLMEVRLVVEWRGREESGDERAKGDEGWK
jgi:hypothetical protein